jgi:hypothetical protein
MHDTTPPSLDEIHRIVVRRRRHRQRAAQGAVSLVALGALGYAGLRVGRDDTTEIPFAADPTPTEQVEPIPSPSPTAEPPPRDDAPATSPEVDGCGVPGGPLPDSLQPAWLVAMADEYLLGIAQSDATAAVDLAAEWGIGSIESKAILGLTGWPADPSSGPLLDDLLAVFDDRRFDRADARTIAADWNMAPDAVRALAAVGESTIVDALERCARS